MIILIIEELIIDICRMMDERTNERTIGANIVEIINTVIRLYRLFAIHEDPSIFKKKKVTFVIVDDELQSQISSRSDTTRD